MSWRLATSLSLFIVLGLHSLALGAEKEKYTFELVRNGTSFGREKFSITKRGNDAWRLTGSSRLVERDYRILLRYRLDLNSALEPENYRLTV